MDKKLGGIVDTKEKYSLVTNREEFKVRVSEISKKRINKLHKLAKLIWAHKHLTTIDLQNKCKDAWDSLEHDLGTKIIPLIEVKEDKQTTNLIFGSGSFSTGKFQAEQFQLVKKYATSPPILLQGLVANKSFEHKCNAKQVAKEYQVPLVELDFDDWYHENIDKNEERPIKASRYWYPPNAEYKPDFSTLNKRFKIRQEQFHRELGELIGEKIGQTTDLVSARGYNFQFCRNIFRYQTYDPFITDTHPADLSYIDSKNKTRLYPGWQSGAVQLMINDNLKQYRGSLIEVDFMDRIEQINELDEGALIALSEGVPQLKNLNLDAKMIQDALKVMDDYFFCTLEATGLILAWGITERKIPVVYQDINGEPIIIKQRAIIVGNKVRSGANAWGINDKKDITELEEFLIG